MRILLVSSRYPLPPWRGNQLRTVQWLSALGDHELCLYSPRSDADVGALPSGLRFVRLPAGGFASVVGIARAVVSGRPVQEGLYETGRGRRSLGSLLADWRPDLAVVQMVRCGWAADAIARMHPSVPVLFDAIDCMGLHYRRAASLAPAAARAAYRFEAERCRRRESELTRCSVLTTAVSSRDLEALGAGGRGMVVPVSGGTESEGEPPKDRDPVVLLSGNLGYRPTADAARWFAGEVWPEVRRRVPSARWIVAGARPGPGIRRLGSLPGVEIHGDVDDLGVFIRQAGVAIAPMSGGSGVPIKILEALSSGVPVVADPWSASGLEEPSAVATAEGRDEWTGAVTRLLSNPSVARDQSIRGLEIWRRHYHPDRVSRQIRTAVEKAGSAAE